MDIKSVFPQDILDWGWVELWGLKIHLHLSDVVLTSLLVSVLLVFFSLRLTRNLSVENPGNAQLLLESLFIAMARTIRDFSQMNITPFFNLIATFWIFVTCANLIGLLPIFGTPTRDLGAVVALSSITSTQNAAITSVQAVYVPADDITDPAPSSTFAHLDTVIILSRDRAAKGFYPSIDLLASSTKLLDPEIVGQTHYQTALDLKYYLQRYRDLEDVIAMLGLEELSQEDRLIVSRARKLERFLTQPFYTTEVFTGRKGAHVPLQETISGCRAILDGQYDQLNESHFYLIGHLDELPQT